MTARSHIPLRTKLAAALCHMLRPDESGKLVPVIPHEDAKMMSEDQVLSLFAFDHFPIRKVDDGPDVHWNLTPRPIAEHRAKTANIDIPQNAKRKRLTPAHEEFRARVLAKAPGQKRQPSGKIPSRPFPRGRGFPKRQTGGPIGRRG